MNFPHNSLDGVGEGAELRALDFDVLLAIISSGRYGYRVAAETATVPDIDSFVAALNRRVALFTGGTAATDNIRRPLGAFLPKDNKAMSGKNTQAGNYEDAVYLAALGNIKSGDAIRMFQFNRIESSEAHTADRGIE